jgi:class 3 adenylate cyclase/DNA-binding beta-propeller fold protein YncE
MPGHPTATITFLFSDIEGSTRLLRELRDRYAELMSDHQRLLRRAFAEHDGREIDTQGDSFFAAFPRAWDAVLAAAKAQRALARHPWPGGVDLRARIGLHTGGASVAGGRYLGLAVHRAARICAVAHGGQVLLSQATYTLLEDEEEELAGLSLRDLGEHALKDFDRPVRLYQLVVPDLQTDFPPLRAAVGRTPFGGREGDLAEAAEAAVAVPFARRRRRPLIVGAAAVAIAAAAVTLGVVLSRSPSRAHAQAPVRPNSVAAIDPKTNRVVDDVGVGDTPTAVAYGEDGVWVSNTASQTVSRIDPRTLTVRTVGVPGRPADLATLASRVFVAELFGERLFVLGPAGDLEETIATGPGTVGRDSGLGGIVAGRRTLWLFESRRGLIARVDPQSDTIVKRTPLTGEVILAFALTNDALWATTLQQDVLRINPQTGQVLATVPLTSALNGVAVDGDDVWVAAGSHAVEIDAATDAVENTVVVAQQEPTGEAFGKEVQGIAIVGDEVWVTDPVGGRVVRIDRRTRTVEGAIRVGHRPAGLAAGGGRIWVAVQA